MIELICLLIVFFVVVWISGKRDVKKSQLRAMEKLRESWAVGLYTVKHSRLDYDYEYTDEDDTRHHMSVSFIQGYSSVTITVDRNFMPIGGFRWGNEGISRNVNVPNSIKQEIADITREMALMDKLSKGVA